MQNCTVIKKDGVITLRRERELSNKRMNRIRQLREKKNLTQRKFVTDFNKFLFKWQYESEVI